MLHTLGGHLKAHALHECLPSVSHIKFGVWPRRHWETMNPSLTLDGGRGVLQPRQRSGCSASRTRTFMEVRLLTRVLRGALSGSASGKWGWGCPARVPRAEAGGRGACCLPGSVPWGLAQRCHYQNRWKRGAPPLSPGAPGPSGPWERRPGGQKARGVWKVQELRAQETSHPRPRSILGPPSAGPTPLWGRLLLSG